MTKDANPIGILLREPWIETASDLPSPVEMLLGIGFDFLEIPEKGYNFGPEQLNYLRKLNEDGKVLFTLHSSTPGGRANLTNPKVPLNIEPTFQLAKTIGAKLVVVDFDPVATLGEQRHYPTVKTRAKKVVEMAEKIEAAAAFENGDVFDHEKCGHHKFGMRAEDFQRLAGDIPELKITLDFGHLFLSAGYWGFDWKTHFIEPLAPRIVHTHLHDNFGKEGGSNNKSLAGKLGDLHLPLDMGRAPWREMITTLLEQGYSGRFTLEIKPENFSFTEEEVTNHIETSYQLLSDFIRRG